MVVTTDNVIDLLRNVVELLKIDDDEKVDLAIDILTLVINFIGVQNIADALENGMIEAFDAISEFISGESNDLTFEQRNAEMKQTRTKLDDLFAKMTVLHEKSAL